ASPWPAPLRWRPCRRPCTRTRTCPSRLSLRLLCLAYKFEPRVGTGVAALGDHREPRQVGVPALAVCLCGLLAREAAVHQGQSRPGLRGLQLDLDGARAGRDELGPAAAFRPAPCVDEPPRRVDLDELAARDAP